MIEIYVVDKNIWCLDAEMRDELVMLDFLICIKVILVYMNAELSRWTWFDVMIVDFIVYCGVKMFNEQCVLVMQCTCVFDWMWRCMLLMRICCNVYVPLIDYWRYTLLTRVCDAWNGKWICDIWFALIHGRNCASMIGRNLCKYDWWELNWDDDYMIGLCIVKGW